MLDLVALCRSDDFVCVCFGELVARTRHIHTQKDGGKRFKTGSGKSVREIARQPLAENGLPVLEADVPSNMFAVHFGHSFVFFGSDII